MPEKMFMVKVSIFGKNPKISREEKKRLESCAKIGV